MTILVSEAIPLLREALVLQLGSSGLVTVIGTAADMQQLQQMLREECPDMLWLDGAFAESKENDCVKSLAKEHPGLKILVFGQGDAAPDIKKYFKQGVFGYLPKTSSPDEIEDALKSLAKNKQYIPPSLNPTFSDWLTGSKLPGKKQPCSHLTRRENEVLQLIVEELTTHEIALQLFISSCTVETHRQKIIQKLGVKNTAGIVREAIYNQLYIHG
ncbi:MAG: LuxR C-terminal-related transcriptional regulator [Saprospiraceae bacterium]